MTYTCEEALPRTLAPIAAALGAQTGFVVGAAVGVFLGFFPRPKAKVSESLAIVGATTVATAGAFGVYGYATGYIKSNLLMASIPAIKNVKSCLLLGPELSSQFYLFLGALLLPPAILVLSGCINAKLNENRNNSPRPS
jgi:hypothetical protein